MQNASLAKGTIYVLAVHNLSQPTFGRCKGSGQIRSQANLTSICFVILKLKPGF